MQKTAELPKKRKLKGNPHACMASQIASAAYIVRIYIGESKNISEPPFHLSHTRGLSRQSKQPVHIL